MKTITIRERRIFRSILMILLMLASQMLSAQNAVSFEGTWVIDHARSNAEFKDYNIFCNITQNSRTMTVGQIFQTTDGEQTKMQPITYNLDGKETSKEEQGGTDRISASWSADKKTVTTKFVRTMNGNNYGTITTYNLSADGKVLTVKSTDLTGVSPMVQVYTRK